MRKPRRIRPKEKNVPKGYDSNWEYTLHNTILKDWKHHTKKLIEYIVEHKYEPDFIRKIDDKIILMETKGRFWDYNEYNKYVWIKKALPENYELVFVFKSPSSPMPQAKRRKDGTKRSHAEWAEANNFRWFNENTLPKEWVSEYNKEEEE